MKKQKNIFTTLEDFNPPFQNRYTGNLTALKFALSIASFKIADTSWADNLTLYATDDVQPAFGLDDPATVKK